MIMEKPLPLIEIENTTRKPYPVECLPKVMGEAVEAITEHVKCAPEIAAFNVIGAVTHLAQTRVDVETRLGRMPTSLFTLATGGSGEGKSASRDIAFMPIQKVEEEKSQNFTTDLREWQEKIDTLHGKELKEFRKENPMPFDPRTIIDSGDASLSRIISMFANGMPHASWTTDEALAFFSSHNMNRDNKGVSLGALTKLFDSGNGERVRSSANQDAGGRFYNRRLSLMLLVQPEVVQEYLADPMNRQQGFLPRMLFTAPPSTAHKSTMEVKDSGKRFYKDPRILTYWQHLEGLQKLSISLDEYNGVITQALKFTSDANEVFAVNHNNLIKQLEPRTGELEIIKAFALRNNQVAARLAAVFAFFEGKDVICDDNFIKAAYLANHSLNEWLAQTYSTPTKAKASIAYQAIHSILIKFIQDLPKEEPSKWLSFQARTAKQYGANAYRDLPTSKHRQYLNELVAANYLILLEDGKTYSLSPWLIFNKEIKSATPATAATTATNILEALQQAG